MNSPPPMPNPAAKRVSPLLPLAVWQSSGQSFAWREQNIFWQEAGAEHVESLLLIHGFPTASWDWSGLWETLARRWRLLAPDLLGFGFSAKPLDWQYSISDQADLCEALLKAKGITRYHILAHDYGDSVAQELLARQGQDGQRPTLASVCFLNGGLFPEAHRPRLIQRLLASPLGHFVAQRVNMSSFAQNITAIAGPQHPPTQSELDGFWVLLQHGNGSAVLPMLIGYLRERRRQRARWVAALTQSRVPLRLINGAADPVSGAHLAARYHALVPAADCVLLAGIGHYPQIEASELVAELFLNFHATRVSPLAAE